MCVCVCACERQKLSIRIIKNKGENVFRDSSYHPSVPLSASAHPCLPDTKQTLRESGWTQCDPLIYRKQLWPWIVIAIVIYKITITMETMIWFHEDNGDCMLIFHQNSAFSLSVCRYSHSARLHGDKHLKYPDVFLLVGGRTILSMRKLYSKLH